MIDASADTDTGPRQSLLAARISRVRVAVRDYVRTLLWLARDSILRFKLPTARVIFTDVVSVGALGVALLILMQYGRLLETGGQIAVLGRVYEARTSVELLVAASAALCLSLALNGVLGFDSRATAIRLRQRYEQFCSQRVFRLLSQSDRIWSPTDDGLATDRTVLLLAKKDARYCGRVFVLLVQGIVPAVTLVAVIAVLLYINVTLTLALFVIIIASLGFLARTSARAAHASETYEESGKAASKQYKHLLKWAAGASFPTPSTETWVEDGLFNTELGERYFDSFTMRLKATEDNKLVSSMVFAIAFFTILIGFGSSVLRTGEGFSLLLVYLLVLRKGMGDFRIVNQRISGISRFYPQVRRYHAYIRVMERRLASKAGGTRRAPNAVTLTVEEPELPESQEATQLEAGRRCGVLGPVGLSRFSLALLVDSMLEAESSKVADAVLASSGYATSDYHLLPGTTFSDSVGLGADIDQDELARQLTALGFDEEAVTTLPNVNETCTGNEQGEIDQGVLFALAALSCRRNGSAWVFLSEDGLAALPPDVCASLLEIFNDRVVFIVYAQKNPDVGGYGEDVTCVVDGERLLGTGSTEWLTQHLDVAREQVREGPFDSQGGLDGSGDDEDDDEL